MKCRIGVLLTVLILAFSLMGCGSNAREQTLYKTIDILFNNDEMLVSAIEESTDNLVIGLESVKSNERPADKMLRERYADLFTQNGLDAFLAKDDAYRIPLYIHHAGVTPAIETLTVERAESSDVYSFTVKICCDGRSFSIIGSAKFNGDQLEEFHFNADLWETFLIERAKDSSKD